MRANHDSSNSTKSGVDGFGNKIKISNEMFLDHS